MELWNNLLKEIIWIDWELMRLDILQGIDVKENQKLFFNNSSTQLRLQMAFANLLLSSSYSHLDPLIIILRKRSSFL